MVTKSCHDIVWRRICLLCILAAVCSLAVPGGRESVARPQYKNVFAKLYNKVEKSKGVKCIVCHTRKESRDRSLKNHYGSALEKALKEEKNVKDEEKVKKALRSIEDGKCPDGTKWKPGLDSGEYPCPHETNGVPCSCRKDWQARIRRLTEQPEI